MTLSALRHRQDAAWKDRPELTVDQEIEHHRQMIRFLNGEIARPDHELGMRPAHTRIRYLAEIAAHEETLLWLCGRVPAMAAAE